MEAVESHEKQTSALNHKISSFWKSHWAFASFVALALLIFISLQSLYSARHGESGLIVVSSCGSTPAEAKANGCFFDRITYGWTPPECFYAELEETVYQEAMRKGASWRWWLDSNYTQEIPQDWEDLSFQAQVWGENRYHVTHCLYAWRVLHQAAMNGGLVYGFIGNYGHTTHCAGLLEDEPIPHENVRMLFSGCMRLVPN
jgi:hypothetical protein